MLIYNQNARGFQWELKGVLVFASGYPRLVIFSLELMRPLVRYWRGHLKGAGFIVNEEKHEWKPSTKVEWLGYMINLSKGEFSIPVEKINSLKARLREIKSIVYVPARCLQA